MPIEGSRRLSARLPSRPTLRDEQKTITANRLIDAALELFADRGYDATTVDDITVAAGVSRATFYLHFANIHALTVALASRNLPEIETYYCELDEIQAAADRGALRAWSRRTMRWFDEHQPLLLVLERIMLSGPGAAAGIARERLYTTHMPKYLSRWPETRWAEAELRIWMLVALLGRVQIGWRYGEQMSGVDDALMVDVLVDFWANGLLLGDVPPTSGARGSAPGTTARTS